MKTIHRANLPEQVTTNGKTYRYNGKESANYAMRKSSGPKDSILVKVLQERLKGVTDLRGNLYQPTSHIFTIEEKTKFWYCKTDGNGQRTGIVDSIELTPEQIHVDKHGNEQHNGKFLYDNEQEAQRAAES